jgi:uncharacterized membrane protein
MTPLGILAIVCLGLAVGILAVVALVMWLLSRVGGKHER